MDPGRTIAQLQARLSAPPGAETLLASVQNIVRNVVMNAAARGAAVTASVSTTADRVTVQVTGYGASTVRSQVNAALRRERPTLAAQVRVEAIDRMKG